MDATGRGCGRILGTLRHGLLGDAPITRGAAADAQG
jgi:hypothetical protein